MRDIERLLAEGIETAYELHSRDDGSRRHEVKRRVLGRGRRRRAAKIGMSAVLSVAVVAGAASAGVSLLRRDHEVAGPTAPDLGAVRVVEFGGPIAARGGSLWVANGKLSNDRGDKTSVARVDLATEEVVDGDPSIGDAHNVAVGESGLWSVWWEGDAPQAAGGAIERVDPMSLERTALIERDASAPYDVAVSTVDGMEYVWVVDLATDELLKIDAHRAEIVESFPTPAQPSSVTAVGRFVYVGSSEDHAVMSLDVTTGASTVIDVSGCANDVAVGAGSLWVADSCGDAVQRVDVDDPADVVSIALPDGPSAVEFAQGLAWVVTTDDIARLDPQSNSVAGDRIVAGEFPVDVIEARGSMWVFGRDGIYRLAGDAPPATPPPPEPTAEPRDDPVPEGAERVDVRRHPRAVAAGPGVVWTGEWEVERLDASTGERLGTTELGAFVQALRYDEDAGVLWALVEVAENETSAVVAIDPETDEVVLDRVTVTPSNVSGQHFDARDGTAWVPGRGGVLTRVDADGRVTEIDVSEHFDEAFNEEGSFHVAASEDAVLVFSTDGVVVRVDPATGAHEKVEDIGWNVADVDSDGESVWVAQQAEDGDVKLWTFDGGTGKRRGDPVDVARFGYVLLSEHAGRVWVVQGGTRDLGVKAYEGGIGEAVQELRLPGGQFTTDVDAGAAGLWVTTGESFLYRVAPD